MSLGTLGNGEKDMLCSVQILEALTLNELEHPKDVKGGGGDSLVRPKKCYLRFSCQVEDGSAGSLCRQGPSGVR